MACSAGGANFTPHIITVAPGEVWISVEMAVFKLAQVT
jgi:hypothetical protein